MRIPCFFLIPIETIFIVRLLTSFFRFLSESLNSLVHSKALFLPPFFKALEIFFHFWNKAFNVDCNIKSKLLASTVLKFGVWAVCECKQEAKKPSYDLPNQENINTELFIDGTALLN